MSVYDLRGCGKDFLFYRKILFKLCFKYYGISFLICSRKIKYDLMRYYVERIYQ